MTRPPAIPLPPAGERRRLREARSLSQAQVAAEVGVSRETVRGWEAGRTTPRGSKREAYAKLLAASTPTPTPAKTPAPAPAPKPAADGGTGSEAPKPERSKTKASETKTSKPEAPQASAEPEPEPAPAPEPVSEPAPLPASLTPAQAFDALYETCAPALVRQAYLLTGRRGLACESVERAFQQAWQRWPEVAVDRDPAGWVRATAHAYALSPWHRLRPRQRHPEAPPGDPAEHALLSAVLALPPARRRTLLLYDGVGLDLPETAAETEASTPATANRLLYARQAVTARLPGLDIPAALRTRLAGTAVAERLHAARPTVVRTGGERRARRWTRAAVAFTALLVGTTGLTLVTAPDHYEEPLSPGAMVRGVPPRAGPGALSQAQLDLRTKLRSETANGPGRLVPVDR
ncbi:helix-turn-helix domain-containing protein [Streptomyces sp. NPDC059786]|uniref:helix-turn-helix domain-containing protein n=1 Tax=Streptomyces sp. NPDC059786 TaxID=3346946 RepID=UPI00366815DB